MFWVGFGLLGGILLRLAATVAGWWWSWAEFGPCLLCEKTWEDENVDILFWSKEDEEGGGSGLAKDTLTRRQSMSPAMEKIRTMIEFLLLKNFMMVLICWLKGCLLLALCFLQWWVDQWCYIYRVRCFHFKYETKVCLQTRH